jgi:hypothetical protein
MFVAQLVEMIKTYELPIDPCRLMPLQIHNILTLRSDKYFVSRTPVTIYVCAVWNIIRVMKYRCENGAVTYWQIQRQARATCPLARAVSLYIGVVHLFAPL